MNKKRDCLAVILGVFFWCLFLAQPAWAGFGIAPAILANDYAVPGGHFSQTFYLVRNNADKPLTVQVNRSQLGRINDWIKIEPAGIFIIPAGVKQFPVKITVEVPKDAPYEYNQAILDFSTIPVSQGAGVTTALGASLIVRINVTDKVFADFRLISAAVPSIEVGWPVKFVAKIQNLGNVPIRPNSVLLEVWDYWNKTKLYNGDLRNFTMVAPFETGESTDVANWPLEPGRYWARYQVFKQGQPLRPENTTFDVYPQWTLTKKPLWMAVRDYFLASPLRLIIGTFVGTLLFLLLIYLLARLLRKKRDSLKQDERK